MDSPDNTDNSWKELQLYHIHFNCTSPAGTQLTDALISGGNSAAAASVSSPGAGQQHQSSSFSRTGSTLLWLVSTEDLLVRIPMEQVSFMNAIIRRLQPGK